MHPTGRSKNVFTIFVARDNAQVKRKKYASDTPAARARTQGAFFGVGQWQLAHDVHL